MDVICVRHGNTFEAGQPAVWVGARTDLPLTARGREQAMAVGAALKACQVTPRRILTGPLKRTVETAIAVSKHLALPESAIVVDDRLRELDYGDWEGKSSDEIRATGSAIELDRWEKQCEWPTTARWPSSYDAHVRSFRSVFADLGAASDEVAMLVSSNGLFRLIARWIDGRESAKMATGHVSILRVTPLAIEIVAWNLAPSALEETHFGFDPARP